MDNSRMGNGIVMVLIGGFFVLVLPLALALFAGGLILLSLGLLFPPHSEIEPKPGYEFCDYCAEEIPISAEVCPACTAPNHSKSLNSR